MGLLPWIKNWGFAQNRAYFLSSPDGTTAHIPFPDDLAPYPNYLIPRREFVHAQRVLANARRISPVVGYPYRDDAENVTPYADNVMLMGDETAHHLGINVERVKLLLLAFSSLLAAAAVAVSGVIGFVGLVVPHITRLIVGPDHRRLLPATVLMGAALLTVADVAARKILPGSEVPIGIVTTFVGCPFFIFLLWRTKRGT